MKTKWTIELEINDDMTINLNDGMPTTSKQVVLFNNIDTDREGLDLILSSAFKNDRIIDIKFPEGYSTVRYCIPYENVVSMRVYETTDDLEEDRVKSILDEIETILNDTEETEGNDEASI